MKPFEKRLADLPLHPPPEDWRETILAAAEAKSRRQVIPFPSFLRAHPIAWAALAAGWMVIGFLNFSGPDLHSLAGDSRRMPTATQMAEYLERREHLIRRAEATDAIFPIDRTKL
jgi:hypothetical protein